jgi:hypothetical protein
MKELKFIHITKCAGSSIEACGKEQGILWGIYHTEYYTNYKSNWHTIFSSINKNIKDKYDWFMVVRNPYSRILSEYYCKWGGIGNYNCNCNSNCKYKNVREFNNYLINKINNRLSASNGNHYMEQYKYLDPTVNIHIIKFENLNEEFTNLMNLYNIKNITLKKENSGENKQFTISDFSDELINLINTVYDKDFEIFQYTKIQKYKM